MNTILKKHIFSLVFTLLCLGAALFGVFFLFNHIQRGTDRVTEIKERIASYQSNKRAFEAEAIKLSGLEKRLNTLEGFIVTGDSIPETLSVFEKVAATRGVGIEITSVQTPVEGEKTKLVIEFNLKGAYNQIALFLSDIVHQKFQVTISKLYLFSAEGEQAPATTGTLQVGKPKTPVAVPKEKSWQAVVTAQILSF